MRVYLRALSFFRPDLGAILLLLLLIAAATLLGLLQVWPLAVLVDSVMAPSPRDDWAHRLCLGLLPDGPVARIAGLAVAALLLRLAQEVLNVLRTLLNLRIGYRGLMRVRCELYRKLQELSLAFHRSQPQGDVISRLSTDATGPQAVLNVLITTAVAAVTLAVMTAVLAARSAELTLLALAVAPPLVLANVCFGRLLKHRAREAREVEGQYTTAVQRLLASVSLVQAFGREADDYDHFQGTVRSSTRAWLRLHGQELCYGLTVGVIFAAGGALIFGYGGYLVYRDQVLAPAAGGMTTGDLVVFLSYLAMFYDPLCKLTGAGASLQAGAAGAARVFEVLDLDPVIRDAPGAAALPLRPRVLELDGVGFAYRAGRPVLHDVSVRVRPGEMVAFVGPSGVGKSTLLNLLPRFYDPTEGALRLDGADVRRLKVKDVRRHVALVLQENVLLPTTVAENIAYGRPGASYEEVREAAELAGAHDFIQALPQGYSTKVSEGGQNLSGGQRQRLAVARALLTGAPILVLDEPTSALDPEHERQVVQTLRGLKGRRTVIVVSHRLSTVVDCDRIFVLHEGQVVEEGQHDDLVARGGRYCEMARCQMPVPGPAEADCAA